MGVLFLVAGAGALAFCLHNLAYELHLAGKSGEFHTVGCRSVGSGKSRTTTCYGTFRSDDGRVVDQDAAMDAPLTSRLDFPVQWEAPRTYHEVSPTVDSLSLGLALESVAFGTIGVLAIAPFPRGGVPSRTTRRAGWVGAVGGLGGLGMFGLALLASAWS